jgi:hypothetical protein
MQIFATNDPLLSLRQITSPLSARPNARAPTQMCQALGLAALRIRHHLR